ncbi:MAG: biopolymer transporter ExbD [Myxococcota bacterium]|nr:biopolymer transporter ExbD [Myxococcota bacterium]
MARKKISEEVEEPNLVPVMNLVMLLIPFLLMASAFFEVAIINVSAPKVASGPSADDKPKDDKPKLNLTVVVSNAGFKICAYGGCLGPGGVRQEGGPANGPAAGGAPTVGTRKFSHECLDNTATPQPPACSLPMLSACRSDLSANHDYPYPERLSRNMGTNGESRKDCNGDGKVDVDVCPGDPTDCNYLDYDYPALRTQLAKLKAGAEQERKVMIMADENVPFEVVIGVMDAARDMKTESGETKELFPDVVLSPGFQ